MEHNNKINNLNQELNALHEVDPRQMDLDWGGDPVEWEREQWQEKLRQKIGMQAHEQNTENLKELDDISKNIDLGIDPGRWQAVIHQFEDSKRKNRCLIVSGACSWEDFEDAGMEPHMSVHWNDQISDPVMNVKVRNHELITITQNGLKPFVMQFQSAMHKGYPLFQEEGLKLLAIENWNTINGKAKEITLDWLNYCAQFGPFVCVLVDSKVPHIEMVGAIENAIQKPFTFESKVLHPQERGTLDRQKSLPFGLKRSW